MADKQSRKIAIVGGSGSVGSPTVEALLSHGIHTVTAISRSESTATFPSGVTVKIGSYNDEEFLVVALRGQDVLILQLEFMALDSQIRCESWCTIGLMAMKNKYRDQIDSLGVSSWIGIVNGPCLPDSKLSAFKNDFVYFSSFLVSQRDVFDSVLSGTGTKESDWAIESDSPDKAADAAKEAIRQGNEMGNVNSLFATLSMVGDGGDYEAKVMGNDFLGLEQEDFDKVVKDLVEKME
ncbi:hypothetical protein VC83_04044 [Pseudogymnoascus destructans]|uniref:NAD(P)-binding domain-containing protein n=1 Tax=Pseudogymnoascus destructans TaxID=655981 RepID=A0A177ACB9_9PEZI|nr:uncharacterized protein VC83_04044 [Pseudogymnoascus destructans]OAF59755.1 hypothetical protein VC83_04044 [Pseudogymnoascus destructans]